MLKFILLALIVSLSIVNSQTMNIQVYEKLNAQPWESSDIICDTVKTEIKELPLDSVEFKLIRGYNRMNPDEKGPNYLELKFICDKNGQVKIDLSKLKDGDIFNIIAYKKNHISVRRTFKLNKDFSKYKWHAFLVKLN